MNPREPEAAPTPSTPDAALATEEDDSLTFSASLRLRGEVWSVAHDTRERDARHAFVHARTRAGLEWRAAPQLLTGFELQDLRFSGLPDRAPRGPGAAYFNANGERRPEHLGVRQLFAEFAEDGLSIRAGRLLIRDGMGPSYADAAFQKVRDRGDSRLVGIREWPGGGRTYDGLRLAHSSDSLFLQAYGAELNKSAFAVQETFHSLEDHTVAGVDLFVLPDVLVPCTELRLFAVSIRDGRPVTETALGDEIAILSFGFQLATQHDLGPGQWDAFLWFARQTGDFGLQSHHSNGWIAEAGYRWPELPGSPWLRVGHARAQGDDDPTDASNQRFYNGVPTNHPRYGLLDLFAFSNLRDSYAELWLTPAKHWSASVALHHFAVADSDDASISGGGAFDDDSFGFGALPTNGARDLGWEVDLVTTVALPSLHSSVSAGYSHFFGSTVFERRFSRDDAAFAWLQWTLRY